MFIINAPMLFTGVWAVCKGFLDEKTRAKIKIFGSKYQTELLEICDPESIPHFLGGTCKCEERGGCVMGDAGPWNDYELVKPIGIRKKVVESPLTITENQNNQEEEEE
jgi:CRAL/TRIO domain